MHIGKNERSLETSHCLTAMQMALTQRQVVRINYHSADGKETERDIEPFAIYHSVHEDWTLVAYCRLRQDFRSFRLDRMLDVQVLSVNFPPHTLTLNQYVEKYLDLPKDP